MPIIDGNEELHFSKKIENLLANTLKYPHGIATVQRPIIKNNNEVIHRVGEVGIITAFLPDRDIYAVKFDGDEPYNWITMDFANFNKFFTYELKKEYNENDI